MMPCRHNSIDFRSFNSEIVCNGCGSIWTQTKGESMLDFSTDLDVQIVYAKPLNDGSGVDPEE